ncbi:MAG TPA: hypothetical protein PLM53_09620 [Spirochaetota bacterium]|nr:hypothetical protein [Spirochaetota bacterium]HPC40940.1 hypothetical protein [Spirochaetota bacterium]HQF08630.1 hypothetical protein [Spirochaetota bacterium]HQH97345.1 hypothetical protein [Spirochaetota bacterium]HQJ70856.1 hypothetical protein [Spirochaetota bacterium]
MKQLFTTAIAAVFAIGMVSCSSINIERESCDKACKTAQEACINKLAKDKQGKVSEIKKKACDVTANKCLDECAKKYGAK